MEESVGRYGMQGKDSAGKDVLRWVKKKERKYVSYLNSLLELIRELV